MKTWIVRIGNSRGIRIPGPLLEAAGLQGEVKLTSRRDGLLIRSVRAPRTGWSEAFQEMSKRGDDALLADLPPILSDWDEEEWEWQ